ncbi:hypothetical protein OAI49_02535 [Synechococcus sp. AH-558-M21]|nr:hypothetical protein [Synechococcus sp. AH-558-M21]
MILEGEPNKAGGAGVAIYLPTKHHTLHPVARRGQTRVLIIGSFFCALVFSSSSHKVLQATAALAWSYGYQSESAHHISDSSNLHKPNA